MISIEKYERGLLIRHQDRLIISTTYIYSIVRSAKPMGDVNHSDYAYQTAEFPVK
jgi:hypothetical protein